MGVLAPSGGGDVAEGLSVLHVAQATLPMLFLAAVTGRLIWPRREMVGKLIVHPCLYTVLAYHVGFWRKVIAWVHQGIPGQGMQMGKRRHDRNPFGRVIPATAGKVRPKQGRVLQPPGRLWQMAPSAGSDSTHAGRAP